MTTRKETLVQLNEDLVAELDRRAAGEGTSRSALIRGLLGEALGRSRSADVSEQIRAGYEQHPQSDARDAWGDLDRWTQLNSARNRAAVTDEEKEPW